MLKFQTVEALLWYIVLVLIMLVSTDCILNSCICN